jgi:hypothetical protein
LKTSALVLLVLLCLGPVLSSAAAASPQDSTTDSPASSSGRLRDKHAAAYLFYWYDPASGLHTKNADGSDALTDHPTDYYLSFFSYRSPLWFRQELLDMRAAGVDIVLPVFWGSAVESFWSVAGLQNLVLAAQELEDEGQPPPRIGMFFDTSSLPQQNQGRPPDLTTEAGRALFYGPISTFFGLVPKRFRAEVDGRPVIYLYVASMAAAYDQALFEAVDRRFLEEFGTTPLIVRESSWKGIQTDGEYAWGTAVFGPRVFGPSASLGPGFDDSAVQGRPRVTIRDRECGEFYADSWEAVRDSSAKLVSIETWNEFHEGSDIAFSREFGRAYIDATRDNVRRWREDREAGPGLAWTALGRSPYLRGLHPAANGGDGSWRTSFIAGREAAYPDPATVPPSRYIYLDVRDDIFHARAVEVSVTVEYFDGGTGEWWVDYDGLSGAYMRTPAVRLQDSGLWKRQVFHLPDAFFGGRQNFDADLRLVSGTAGPSPANYFSRVWVSTSPLAGQPPDLTGWPDVEMAPGRTLGVGVTASGQDGNPPRLLLDRAPSFCRLVDYGNGTGVVLVSPTADDIRPCPYRIRVVAGDPGTPGSADAATLFLRVIAPQEGNAGATSGLARER